MAKTLDSVLQMVFPNLCVGCGSFLSVGEDILCDLCDLNLPLYGASSLKENAVTKGFWGRVNIVYGSALLVFSEDSLTHKVLHNIKYKSNTDLAHSMGIRLGRSVLANKYFDKIDIIVPVPLHPRKELLRGYNQSFLLAKGMSEVLSLPISSKALSRTFDSSTQTKKNRFERHKNMANIFEISDVQNLENKHVLLLDDVLTTGATLEACIIALEKVEGIKISVCTLAVVT